jgi:acyl-CoA thioesterase FadM
VGDDASGFGWRVPHHPASSRPHSHGCRAHVNLLRPVKVGDVLRVGTSVERGDRTLMTIAVEALARCFRTHVREKVTSESLHSPVSMKLERRARCRLRFDR